MADILPFSALRYDPQRVSPPQVVTQPYDKISSEMQERYYAASPYNLVRIILGRSEPQDNADHNVYTRAAEQFSRLAQPRSPAPGLTSHRFTPIPSASPLPAVAPLRSD